MNARTLASPFAAVAEIVVETLAEAIALLIQPIYPAAWPRVRAWRYRRKVAEIEAAMEALENYPRFYGSVVDLRHPGTLELKLEAMRAEKRYYERRAEILEGGGA